MLLQPPGNQRPIKPTQRRALWEKRSTRAAALGHLSRLGSHACLLLRDTMDLWRPLSVFGWVCLCVCVRESIHRWSGKHGMKLKTLHKKRTRRHGLGSAREAHHHPAWGDNWKKARVLWVMLLINSIQQTLRRYDYFSALRLTLPLC